MVSTKKASSWWATTPKTLCWDLKPIFWARVTAKRIHYHKGTIRNLWPWESHMRHSEGWHMVIRDKLLGRLLQKTSLFSRTNSAAFNKSTSFWELEWTFKGLRHFPLQESHKKKLLQTLLIPTIIILWSDPNLHLPTVASQALAGNKTHLGSLELRKC